MKMENISLFNGTIKNSQDLIIGIGQEVTEHIKAQKRYENLVESAYD
jgi:hypothetical protein